MGFSKGEDILKEKILIVEDELAISNLIKIHLDMAGYECKQAYDGLEALNAIQSESIDLIVLDVMIPHIDGFSLIEKIRDFNIPVIFLTAKNSVMDKVTELRLGAEDYITKPFEAIELLRGLKWFLGDMAKKIYHFFYCILIDL